MGKCAGRKAKLKRKEEINLIRAVCVFLVGMGTPVLMSVMMMMIMEHDVVIIGTEKLEIGDTMMAYSGHSLYIYKMCL